ncbi:hypothetical protein FZW96_06835 [Bacillus sp. BGMRC 2118]|nr:hypothetical protein FZW96_06835 [Bacillus sp. BGMRC 2118]
MLLQLLIGGKGLENQYIKTGIQELDDILFQGIPVGSSILLEGDPGSGKTTLGLQFLIEGIQKYNHSGIYISFEEAPAQIKRNMNNYNWDLDSHEKSGKLRIVGMSPDYVLEDLMSIQGLLESMIKEIDCKRILIDSITLLKAEKNSAHMRKLLHVATNILKKHHITSILISERTNENTRYEHFVKDGVIDLTTETTESGERNRKLEVQKLRGVNFLEGKHLYKFKKNYGVFVVPSGRNPGEFIKGDYKTTGLPKLDDAIGGGIAPGTKWAIPVDSRSHFRPFLSVLIASRIRAGENFVTILSESLLVEDLDRIFERQGVSLKQLAQDGRLSIVDPYNRPVSEPYKDVVVHSLPNEEVIPFLLKKVSPVEAVKNGEKWCYYYDLSTIITSRGEAFFRQYYPEFVALKRTLGITTFTTYNEDQISTEIKSMVEKTSNGIIRIHSDHYQYLQILKSPAGRTSGKMIVRPIETTPYIELL